MPAVLAANSPTASTSITHALHPALMRGHLILSVTGGLSAESRLILPVLRHFHLTHRSFFYLREGLEPVDFQWMNREHDMLSNENHFRATREYPTGLPWLDDIVQDLGFGGSSIARWHQQRAIELCRYVVAALRQLDAGFTVTDIWQCVESARALQELTEQLVPSPLRKNLESLIQPYRQFGDDWDESTYQSQYTPLLNRLKGYPRAPMAPDRCTPRISAADRLRSGYNQILDFSEDSSAIELALDDLKAVMAERIRLRRLPLMYVVLNLKNAHRYMGQVLNLAEQAGLAHVGLIIAGDHWMPEGQHISGSWTRLRAHASAVLDIEDAKHPLRIQE